MATRRGQGGDRRLRLFPLPPCRLRRGEIPCLRERQAMSGRQAIRSRPSGATQHRCWKEQLGGRSCGSAKLLAGTFRCLRLCGLFSLNWSPVELLGRCPKPHKGAPPLDPARGRRKGTKSPLDPFFAARLERFSLRFGLSGFFRLYSGKGFTYPTSTPTSCSFKIIGIKRASSGVCVTRYSRTFGPILRIDSITSTI